MSGYVFISYSRTDCEYVDELAEYLQNAGIAVWCDYDLEAGDEFAQKIESAVDQCGAFIVVLTPESTSSKWVRLELARAARLNKPRIPLLLRPCVVPIEIKGFNQEDVSGWRMPTRGLVTKLGELVGVTTRSGTSPVARSQDDTSSPPSSVPPVQVPKARPKNLLKFAQSIRHSAVVSPDSALYTMTGDGGPITSLAWSPGSQIAVAGPGWVRTFDPIARRPIQSAAVAGEIDRMKWSPGGSHLAIMAGRHGTSPRVCIWDTRNAQNLRWVATGNEVAGWPRSFAWSPGGRHLAIGHNGGAIHVWDSLTSEKPVRLGRQRWFRDVPVWSVAWSRSGQYLAAAKDRVVEVWHLQSRSVHHSLKGHTEPVSHVAWSFDDERIATIDRDPVVGGDHPESRARIWDTSTGALLRTLDDPRVLALMWSPTAATLAVDGFSPHQRFGRCVRAITQRGETLREFPSARDFAWSPDGQYLALSDWGAVDVWSLATGEPLRSFAGSLMEWSPDSSRLVTADDSLARLWGVGISLATNED